VKRELKRTLAEDFGIFPISSLEWLKPLPARTTAHRCLRHEQRTKAGGTTAGAQLDLVKDLTIVRIPRDGVVTCGNGFNPNAPDCRRTQITSLLSPAATNDLYRAGHRGLPSGGNLVEMVAVAGECRAGCGIVSRR